ncbi:MAG: Gfo/Idh/MocA family oxidoreductase [Armatimonadota bacterium]|nr:Gfo/Idh/MocA family oxidoreductase [Armatimonadota bacterium]
MRTVAVPLRPPVRSVSGPLRMAVIGCGERGAGCCRAVAQTGNSRLVMVMDASPQRAREVARGLDVPWTTSLEEVLARDDVEAVVISTPHHLHAPQSLAAVRAGKHVVVEKPLATSLEDAAAVAVAARGAGVSFSINLSYRYLPHVAKARSLIEAGVLGDLYGVSLIYQKERFADYWEGRLGGAGSDWRMRRETSGGGILINLLIHFIDLLRYLPGLDLVEVSSAQATMEGPGEVEDVTALWLRYANGALATVNASSCARGADIVEFRLWGRDGHLSLTPPYQFYSLRLVDGKRPGQWHRFSGTPGLAQRDVEYFRRFADRVLRGEPQDVTVDDGLAAQAVVEAAYRSAQSGRAEKVEWRPERPGGS